MPDSFAKQQGKLLIVSGPSGVGKGTLLKRVFAESGLPLVLSVSATTRQPRLGETDGVHYHFITPEEFRDKRLADEFLECFEVFGEGVWYGTLRQEVEKALSAGKWVVLEIDVQGAKKVKEQYSGAVMLFVRPKNAEVLKERLVGRGTETEESVRRRLTVAQDELSHADEFEYQIVNDDLDVAAGQFIGILKRQNT